MPIQEFFRPTGRSVWTAKELSGRTDWIFQLPERALDEIDANVSRLVAKATPLSAVGVDEFPLASLAAELRQIKDEIATGRGFIVVRGLPAEKYSLDELRLLYWGIGTHFGTAMPQSYLGERLGDIIDLSDEEPDIFRRRGYHAGGAQKTHSDCTDIVSMLSLQTARSGGESVLVSAHTVHNLMLDSCPGLLAVMYNGFFMRGIDQDAVAEGGTALTGHRIPTYMHTDGWLNTFYTRGYVDRAVMAGDVRLSPLEQAAVDAFAAFSNHPDICLSMKLLPGDMQFVNNRTMLHGRARFEDFPEKARRRHLFRLWLTVPEWPRMAKLQDMHGDDVKLRWEDFARKQLARAG